MTPDFPVLRLRGYKSLEPPLFGSLLRGTNSSCYSFVTPGLNYFEHSDICDSAVGNLGSSWWGNLVWLGECEGCGESVRSLVPLLGRDLSPSPGGASGTARLETRDYQVKQRILLYISLAGRWPPLPLDRDAVYPGGHTSLWAGGPMLLPWLQSPGRQRLPSCNVLCPLLESKCSSRGFHMSGMQSIVTSSWDLWCSSAISGASRKSRISCSPRSMYIQQCTRYPGKQGNNYPLVIWPISRSLSWEDADFFSLRLLVLLTLLLGPVQAADLHL